MCDFSYYFVIDIIVNVNIFTIMMVTVDFYSFVIRVMWTSLCSVFVHGHTDTSYYADLGKKNPFIITIFSVLLLFERYKYHTFTCYKMYFYLTFFVPFCFIDTLYKHLLPEGTYRNYSIHQFLTLYVLIFVLKISKNQWVSNTWFLITRYDVPILL